MNSFSQSETFFDGRVTLYHADAYGIVPTLVFGDYGYDMVTDPPYLIDTSGGGHYRKARPSFDDLKADGLTDGFDLSILSFRFARSIMVFCHNDQLSDILVRLKQGYERVVVRVWRKPNAQPVANKNYRPDTEIIVHAWNRATNGHPRGDLMDKSRVLIFNKVLPSLKKKYGHHPSIKPDVLMDALVTNVAGPILDPFMGTGSTGIAAVKQGKRFIGIEKKRKYFNVACARFADLERFMEI